MRCTESAVDSDIFAIVAGILAYFRLSDMSCIVVDIGNTNTSVGIVRGQRVTSVRHLPGSVALSKNIEKLVRELTATCSVGGSVLCSVVPSAVEPWHMSLAKVIGHPPLIVSHRIKLGVRIDYPKPATIGPDRLANACGAIHRYGAPTVVADFGTALTFDIVSGEGAYVGGIIAPGLPLMTDYLAERTALLPHIRLKGSHGAIGKSTVGAMRIGAKVGYRGMVREIVEHVQKNLGTRRIVLCATGGFARWALEGIDKPFHFDPNLTLYGLGTIYALNTGERDA